MASYDTPFTGNYAGVAESLGGYGERVESPAEITPAIERGIERTGNGVPALLEFITAEETANRSSDRHDTTPVPHVHPRSIVPSKPRRSSSHGSKPTRTGARRSRTSRGKRGSPESGTLYCRTQVMPPFDVCFGAFFDVSSPKGGTLVHELVSDSIVRTGIRAAVHNQRRAPLRPRTGHARNGYRPVCRRARDGCRRGSSISRPRSGR